MQTNTPDTLPLETDSRRWISPELLRQVKSFVLVGGFCTVVDWLGFTFARAYAPLSLAIFAGRFVGSVTNYLLNKTVTFRNKCERPHAQVGVFIVVAFASFSMSEGVAYLLVGPLRISGDITIFNHMHKNLLCYMLTTCIMLPVNYMLQRFIVFNSRVVK